MLAINGWDTSARNSLLRFLLVEAAQAAARWDSDWRRRYLHLGSSRCPGLIVQRFN